jgi:hypothetical protein
LRQSEEDELNRARVLSNAAPSDRLEVPVQIRFDYELRNTFNTMLRPNTLDSFSARADQLGCIGIAVFA